MRTFAFCLLAFFILAAQPVLSQQDTTRFSYWTSAKGRLNQAIKDRKNQTWAVGSGFYKRKMFIDVGLFDSTDRPIRFKRFELARNTTREMDSVYRGSASNLMFNAQGDLFFQVETGLDSFPHGLVLIDTLLRLKTAKAHKYHKDSSGASFIQGDYSLPNDSLFPFVIGDYVGNFFYLYEIHTGLKYLKRHRYNGIISNTGARYHFYFGPVTGTKSGAWLFSTTFLQTSGFMYSNYAGLVKLNRDFTIEKIAVYKPLNSEFRSFHGFAPIQTKPNRLQFTLGSQNRNDPFSFTLTGYILESDSNFNLVRVRRDSGSTFQTMRNGNGISLVQFVSNYGTPNFRYGSLNPEVLQPIGNTFRQSNYFNFFGVSGLIFPDPSGKPFYSAGRWIQTNPFFNYLPLAKFDKSYCENYDTEIPTLDSIPLISDFSGKQFPVSIEDIPLKNLSFVEKPVTFCEWKACRFPNPKIRMKAVNNCERDSAWIAMDSIFQDQKVRWANGDTAKSIKVKIPGWAKVKLVSVCGIYVDSVFLEKPPLPSIFFTRINKVCPLEKDTIPVFNASAFSNIIWRDKNNNILGSGSKLPLPDLQLKPPKDSSYTVYGTFFWGQNCTLEDSAIVTHFFNPLPFFSDSILTCKSDTLLKTPQPGRWAEFIWNTPDTFLFDPILQISKSGTYRLRSLDTEFNCPALVDTFYVGLKRERESVLAVNGNPTFRDSLVFSFPQNLTFSLTEKNARDVQWRISETEFEPGAISKLVIATSEGVYEQEAKYFIGPCLTRAKGKIKLSLDSKDLSIPNLVTLNGDGKNDMFVIQNLEKYSQSNLQVFNRWGKKVFEASPYLNNWKPDLEGNYFFILGLEGKTFSGWLLGMDKR